MMDFTKKTGMVRKTKPTVGSQAPKIFLALLCIVFLMPFVSAGTLKEYSVNDSGGDVGVYTTHWDSQGFTVGTNSSSSFNLSQVSIKIYKDGVGGIMNISIAEANSSGAPSGKTLTSLIYNYNVLGGAPSTWINFSLHSINLIMGNNYSIVVSTNTDSGDRLRWDTDSNPPTYQFKAHYSPDDGSSWIVPGNSALTFMVYGTSIGGGDFNLTDTAPKDNLTTTHWQELFEYTINSPLGYNLSHSHLRYRNKYDTSDQVLWYCFGSGGGSGYEINQSQCNFSETGNFDWKMEKRAPYDNYYEWWVWGRAKNETNLSDKIVYSSPINKTILLKDVIVNDNSFNSDAIEGTTQDYYLEIDWEPYWFDSVVLNLVYNNTNYPATFYETDGRNETYKVEATVPIVKNSQNISFYWEIGMYNGTGMRYYNSTWENQTVSNISLDDCSAYTHKVINYTLRDEDNFNLVPTTDNETFAITLSISNHDFSFSKDYYFNTTAKNVIEICSENFINSSSLRLDAEIQYSSTDRVTEFHNLQNQSVFNTPPLEIDLYDLLITRSQEFLITYKDENYIPVENALIVIKRKYLSLGDHLTVEVPRTDTDGRTIGHFVLNDETYTLEVRKEGRLLSTFENVRAFCDDILTGNCRINLNAESSTTSIEDLQTYKDVRFSSGYDEATRTYTFSFLTIYGDAKNFNLTVKVFDSSLDTTICSKSISASQSSLDCVIAESYGNVTVIAQMYVDSEQIAQDIFSLKLSLSDLVGKTRYLLAFILLLTIPLIAFTSPVMMVVLFLVGLIIAGGLFLLDTGGVIGTTSAILWFIIAGAVILWKLSSGGRE